MEAQSREATLILLPGCLGFASAFAFARNVGRSLGAAVGIGILGFLLPYVMYYLSQGAVLYCRIFPDDLRKVFFEIQIESLMKTSETLSCAVLLRPETVATQYRGAPSQPWYIISQ